jgi:hypothetical protein
MKPTIIAKDKDHLIDLINQETMVNGWECDLNHIDVSQVLSMSFVFCRSKFNGDISQWDVSNVRSMLSMFHFSEFDGDISKWNVSNVMSIHSMFEDSSFSKDLSDWKPYEALQFNNTFKGAKCPEPYWVSCESLEERKRAIDKYHLQKELEKELSNNPDSKKKIKL